MMIKSERDTFRRVAMFYLGEFETARSLFVAGQNSDSENSEFKTWIRKCDAEIEGRAFASVSLDKCDSRGERGEGFNRAREGKAPESGRAQNRREFWAACS